MLYYVYIVRCEDASLYTGITTDVVRRMSEHISQTGKCAKYTRTHKVCALDALWTAPDRASASLLEYRIKQLDRVHKDMLVAHPRTVGTVIHCPQAQQWHAVTQRRRAALWAEANE